MWEEKKRTTSSNSYHRDQLRCSCTLLTITVVLILRTKTNTYHFVIRALLSESEQFKRKQHTNIFHIWTHWWNCSQKWMMDEKYMLSLEALTHQIVQPVYPSIHSNNTYFQCRFMCVLAFCLLYSIENCSALMRNAGIHASTS